MRQHTAPKKRGHGRCETRVTQTQEVKGRVRLGELSLTSEGSRTIANQNKVGFWKEIEK